MKNPWLIPAVALAAGCIGGFITGKNTNSSASANSEQTAPAVRTRSAIRENSSSREKEQQASRSGLREIQSIAGNTNRVQALLDYYEGLSPDEFQKAADELENLPMSERMLASMMLFGRWAEIDPTGAMNYSNTMGFAANFVRPTILSSWASTDPASAAQYYKDNPNEFAMMGMFGGRGGRGGDSAASIISREWARQNPEASLTWAMSLEGNDQAQALEGIAREVSATDPQKAISMLASSGAQDLGAAYRRIAENYGAQDYEKAAAWARTLPADQQESVLSAAIRGFATKDPAAASEKWALLENGGAKDRIAETIVQSWTRIDANAAAKFTTTIADEGAQRNAVRVLTDNWVGTNPQAALEFANTLPAGRVQDQAYQSWVWSNNSGDPQQLAQVASLISDQRERNMSTGIAFQRWMRSDPTAATTAIQGSTLPQDMQNRLINGQPMWGGRRGGRGR